MLSRKKKGKEKDNVASIPIRFFVVVVVASSPFSSSFVVVVVLFLFFQPKTVTCRTNTMRTLITGPTDRNGIKIHSQQFFSVDLYRPAGKKKSKKNRHLTHKENTA